MLCKRWMRDINWWYQIDHDSNEMWIADNLWEDREDGRAHCLPGLRPFDVDEGIVEQATFMGIHIIRKVELTYVSTRLLKQAFLIKVHHRGNADTLPTDKPTSEVQEMLAEFQGHFGEPTYSNSKKGRQAEFEIKPDLNGKISFRSPCRICRREAVELRREIEKAICCGWIQPSWSNFGSAVLFVPKTDCTLRMYMDHRAVNAITVKDYYPLPHIKDLLNSMHGSCWLTQFDLVTSYHQIRNATADGQKTAFTTKFGLSVW